MSKKVNRKNVEKLQAYLQKIEPKKDYLERQLPKQKSYEGNLQNNKPRG